MPINLTPGAQVIGELGLESTMTRRCEQLAREGKKRIDRLNWTWPKRKKQKKIYCDDHAGECPLRIPKNESRMSF
jgi:hypothetical protein